MNDPDAHPEPVRIPADIDREDRLLADLTARQCAILAGAGAAVWLAFTATRHVVPPLAFAGASVPVVVAAVVIALGRRDGLSLDRWLAAGLRQARAPRRLVPAPDGVHPPPAWISAEAAAQARPLPSPLRLPASAITPRGAVELAGGGFAAVAAASTVNFALRTPAEQQALVAAFGRWLNSLRFPAQILVRARRVDLAVMAAEISRGAPALPHPALERAAAGHAAFLAGLAGERDLLARQVLIVVREPTAGQAERRIADTARALVGAGLAVTPLDGARMTALLAACCAPGLAPPAALAPPGQVITGTWPGPR